MKLLAALLCLSPLAFAQVQNRAPAPTPNCEPNQPNLNRPPQTSTPPYRVNVIGKENSSVFDLILAGESFIAFTAFVVRADNGDFLGTFSSPDDDVRLMDCSEGTANAVAQTDYTIKHSASFTWTAPRGFEGQVRLFVDIAREQGVYWKNVAKGRILDVKKKDNDDDDGNNAAANAKINFISIVSLLTIVFLCAINY